MKKQITFFRDGESINFVGTTPEEVRAIRHKGHPILSADEVAEESLMKALLHLCDLRAALHMMGEERLHSIMSGMWDDLYGVGDNLGFAMPDLGEDDTPEPVCADIVFDWYRSLVVYGGYESPVGIMIGLPGGEWESIPEDAGRQRHLTREDALSAFKKVYGDRLTPRTSAILGEFGAGDPYGESRGMVMEIEEGGWAATLFHHGPVDGKLYETEAEARAAVERAYRPPNTEPV